MHDQVGTRVANPEWFPFSIQLYESDIFLVMQQAIRILHPIKGDSDHFPPEAIENSNSRRFVMLNSLLGGAFFFCTGR